MQAVDQLNQIYSSALQEFLQLKGKNTLGSSTTSPRINLYGFSRCAMALPFATGGQSFMMDILKRKMSELRPDQTWMQEYLENQILRSIDIFRFALNAKDGANYLYNLENWPNQYMNGCTLYK